MQSDQRHHVRRWSSHKTLQAIKNDWRADPLDPGIDREMAEILLTANARLAAQIQMPRSAVVQAKIPVRTG
jgi:hypothetical protein